MLYFSARFSRVHAFRACRVFLFSVLFLAKIGKVPGEKKKSGLLSYDKGRIVNFVISF